MKPIDLVGPRPDALGWHFQYSQDPRLVEARTSPAASREGQSCRKARIGSALAARNDGPSIANVADTSNKTATAI